MRLRALFSLLIFVPTVAAAQSDVVTRRDGFLLIWESIRRDTEPVSSSGFADVNEGDIGFEDIAYAANRGILDDAEYFYPDKQLTIRDALLWLMRTRNVADLDEMRMEDLPGLLERYPVADGFNLDERVTGEELFFFIRNLDGALMQEVHEVSFYADDFHGNGTAFGETFDMHAITAAHRTYPHNTLVKVTNVENGQSVIVRVNDRGPYVHGRDMDLSKAAFEKIAAHGQGIAHATFERLGSEDLVDICGDHVRRYQKRITRDVRFHRGIPHTFSPDEELHLGANRFFVVRSITYPDGFVERREQWIGPDENFSFIPPMEGKFDFLIGTATGKSRSMTMDATRCREG